MNTLIKVLLIFMFIKVIINQSGGEEVEDKDVFDIYNNDNIEGICNKTKIEFVLGTVHKSEDLETPLRFELAIDSINDVATCEILSDLNVNCFIRIESGKIISTSVLTFPKQDDEDTNNNSVFKINSGKIVLKTSCPIKDINTFDLDDIMISKVVSRTLEEGKSVMKIKTILNGNFDDLEKNNIGIVSFNIEVKLRSNNSRRRLNEANIKMTCTNIENIPNELVKQKEYDFKCISDYNDNLFVNGDYGITGIGKNKIQAKVNNKENFDGKCLNNKVQFTLGTMDSYIFKLTSLNILTFSISFSNFSSFSSIKSICTVNSSNKLEISCTLEPPTFLKKDDSLNFESQTSQESYFNFPISVSKGIVTISDNQCPQKLDITGIDEFEVKLSQNIGKPSLSENGKIKVETRSSLKGNFTSLPKINIGMVIIKMIMKMMKTEKRNRRRIESNGFNVEMDCTNIENIPPQVLEDVSVAFNCLSKQEDFTENDLAGRTFSVVSFGGKEITDETKLEPEKKKLSGGAIAGIVIGVVAFLVICIIGIVLYIRKLEIDGKKGRKNLSRNKNNWINNNEHSEENRLHDN